MTDALHEIQIIDILDRTFPMRQLSVRNMKNETVQVEKTATVLVRKVRDAILDDVFKPGDWLPEVDLDSRSADRLSAKRCKRLRRRAPSSPSLIKERS